MQSDQRTTNHPIPFRNIARSSDNDRHRDTVENHSNERHRHSTDLHDAIKPATGRPPARSAENMSRARR